MESIFLESSGETEMARKVHGALCFRVSDASVQRQVQGHGPGCGREVLPCYSY